MASAGSKIGKDVPPFCTTQGDRAVLRGLNVVGLRRSGLPREIVTAIRAAYRTLFLSGEPMEAALARLKDGSPPPPVQEMVAFIERARTDRGITMPDDAKTVEEKVTI